MNAKTIFTFAGGVVVGLILGVWLFSAPSQQVSQVPAPVTPQQQQVDTLKLQRDIEQLEQIVKGDPGNYNAWKRLGDNLFDVGEQKRSIEAYQKALAIDDSDPNVWTDMGVMYRQLQDYTKALESFKTAADLSPTHAISRLNTGVVYLFDLNETEKGIAAWEEFLRVQPTGPQADSVRRQLADFKNKTAGPLTEGAPMPPDHPPIDMVDPAGGAGGQDPAGYFPKPDQQ